MTDATSLDGKVALVTGAARGLGAEVVRQLAGEGAHVVGADRRVDSGIEVAASAGANAAFVELDVTEDAAWTTVVDAVVAEHGRLDILVNNAGIIRANQPIVACDPDEFRKVIDTNLTSTFLGIRAVAPHLAAAGGGSIINLSSPAGFEATPGMPAYSASKWAIRGLTRTAAVELGPDNIRVNTVVPGPMRTAMTRRKGWSDEDYGAHYGASVPLGRMGEVAEVAALIVWLASDAASYCTGGDYAADGGVSA